jgi:molecular chaperone GrpE (heat shock protein)
MRSERSQYIGEFKKLFLHYAAGILLMLAAIAVFVLGLFPRSTTDENFLIAAIMFVGACGLLFWTYQQNLELNSLEAWPSSIEEIKKLSREYYKNTAAIQENSNFVKQLYEAIDRSDNSWLELRKPLEELLIKQRQENGNLQRKIELWQSSAIAFFQILERAIDYEKKDKHKRLLERLTLEFESSLMNLGLERIIPQLNEPVNEMFHEVIAEIESTEATPGNILNCSSWGYRIGDSVLGRSQVILARSVKEREDFTAKDETETSEPITSKAEEESAGQ